MRCEGPGVGRRDSGAVRPRFADRERLDANRRMREYTSGRAYYGGTGYNPRGPVEGGA